uniref:Uncharacterized protein n=1 Tax=Arundo donax TaxID=35708 RepID=A0A0A9C936_ARUDO
MQPALYSHNTKHCCHCNKNWLLKFNK